jgi:hypothetical protein
MDLASFSNRKIMSMLLLLACIFISLAMSDIPYFVSLGIVHSTPDFQGKF